MGEKRTETTVSELEDHIGYWIRYVSNHVSSTFAPRLAEADVSVSEWVALRSLYSLGETSQNELAASMGMTKGPVSRILDRLLRKKLASRKESGLDARANVVCLTEPGRRLVPKLAEIADCTDHEFFAGLSQADRTAIVRIMRKLVAHHQLSRVPVD